MEERSETPVLLIYKVTSTTSTTSRLPQSVTTYHVRMSKDVKELSIKRSSTAGKIAMSMRKEKSLAVKEKKVKPPSSFGQKSWPQQKPETTIGFETIIPEYTSLTTHGAAKSNYDNQAYWTETLQTSGGLALLAQASQDYSGSSFLPISTNSSTSGGVDTTDSQSSQSKNGVQKTNAPDHNSKYGQIGTHSQPKSKEEASEIFDLPKSLYSPITRSKNVSRTNKTKNLSNEDSKW